MEILSWINFILSNFLLITASTIIYYRLFKKREKNESGKKIISTFIIYISIITILEIFLGIIGQLNYTSVLITTYLLSFLIILLNRKNTITYNKSLFKPNLLTILVFTPFIIIFILRAFNAIIQVPLEYDSLAYHLPFMAEWLQTASIKSVYYSAFASPIGYYPSNHELLDLWLALPFKNDFLINLINFPIIIILIISLWEIFKTLKIDKTIRIFSIASLVYIPIFLRQIGLPLVDIFFCTTFSIAIYYLIKNYQEKENTSNLIIFGLAIGLFIGTKYLGIVYSAIPLIIFFLINILEKKLIKKLLITSVCILLTGSFFYIRNFIDSGNPLFPTEIILFGKQIFQGYPNMNDKITNTSILNNIHTLSDIKFATKTYFHMTGYNFRLYALLLIPLTILTFKKINNEKKLLITIIFSTIAYFYLYLISPYSWRDFTPNIRYSMPFLLLLTICSSIFINKIKHKTIFYLLISLGITHTIIFLIFFTPEHILHNDKIIIDLLSIKENLIQFAIFCITISISMFLIFINSKKIKTIIITVIIISSSYLAYFSINTRNKYAEYFYNTIYQQDKKLKELSEAFIWLNKNTNAKRVAYTGFNFHYPLYGENINREVNYININDCKNCRYVNYKNSPQSIRTKPNENAWLNNLKIANKEYIIISSKFAIELQMFEKEWINKNPNNFKLIYHNDTAEIYKILSLP